MKLTIEVEVRDVGGAAAIVAAANTVLQAAAYQSTNKKRLALLAHFERNPKEFQRFLGSATKVAGIAKGIRDCPLDDAKASCVTRAS